MQTSALVTLLNQEFPDWSRTRLLTFVNEVHRIVFSQTPTAQMRLYDTATGKDPVLTTTSGDYDYVINITNGFTNDVWRVTEVYLESEDSPTEVMCYDATPSVGATIVFREDPGTGTYYIRAYRFPTAITAESVQIEVPHAFHITHFYDGVAGLVEKFRSGKSERWMMFMAELLPDLVKRMSDGKRRSFFVTPKGY